MSDEMRTACLCSAVHSWNGATSGERETPWVDPARFFAGLPDVMSEVPARPGEEAWYRWLESLLQAAADGRWRSC